MSETQVEEHVTDQGETTDDTDEPTAIERLAQQGGWAPKDKWRGDPENWKPAEKFLQDTLGIEKAQRQTIAQLRQENEERDKELKAVKRGLDSVQAWTKTYEKDTRERILKEMESAVDNSDTEAFNRARDQLDRHDEERSKPETTESDDQPGVKPEVKQWVDANPWFTADKVLNAAASAIHEQLLAEKPGIPLAENLEEVAKEVKRRFPEKFDNEPRPRREGAADVEGGGNRRTEPRKGSWEALPAEAKRAYEKEIAPRLGDKYSKEQYAKEYWAQENE